jgi:uncharacterized low-complexity protein
MMMINFRNAMAALAVAVAVASAASSAMAAQKRTPATNPGYAARAQAVEGNVGEANMTKDRDAAIRECSGKANALSQTNWGYMQGNMYRTCMAEHGQME